MSSIQLIKWINKKKKKRSTISDNTTPCRRLPDVCLFCSYVWMDMYVMLWWKGTVCARKRGETITSYILSQWPQVQGSFFFFFFTRFCHIIVVASRPNACTIFFFHTYIYSYIRCVQASSLSRTKIFLLFFFFRTYIYTDDVEKIAAGRKRRTRLSILRNDDVWARVYTQANVLFLLLT
jgi:hypothetical protein